MKLWAQEVTAENKKAELFTVGDDYLLDAKLLYWDAVASIAHAAGLRKIEILTDEECIKLQRGLQEIITLHKNGQFVIRREDEDSHTAIENYLTEKLGEVGKKIHTGRSRNDQVLAALKLFIKSELFEVERQALEFCKTIHRFSKDNDVPFPGYTHMQKAMPSTIALWGGAYLEAMLENIRHASFVRNALDSSPLGSAAGYGVNLHLDREYVASLLGFAKVQNNVLAVQNSRGKNEAQVLGVLHAMMLDLNRLATDIILFSLPERGFLEISEEFCTGSSIMPQKRNPDVLELVRAKAKAVGAALFQVVTTLYDLPSGYNRDLQLTKRPLIEGFAMTISSLDIMTDLIQGLKVNESRCREALTDELFAADVAYEQVRNGVSFRDAYRNVKNEQPRITAEEKTKFLSAKTYTGAPGNVGLERDEEELASLSESYEREETDFRETIARLSKDL